MNERCGLLLGVLVLVGACAPPPLLGPPDAGASQDASIPVDDTGSTGGETPPFGEVAELVRQRCAKAGCHVSSSSGVGHFKVSDSDASDEAIAEALRDQSLDGEEGVIVEPGEPEASAMYTYVTGDRQPRMPLSGPLDDDQIQLIRKWVAAGAPYE